MIASIWTSLHSLDYVLVIFVVVMYPYHRHTKKKDQKRQQGRRR